MFLKLELLLSLEVTLAEKPQMKINKKHRYHSRSDQTFKATVVNRTCQSIKIYAYSPFKHISSVIHTHCLILKLNITYTR